MNTRGMATGRGLFPSMENSIQEVVDKKTAELQERVEQLEKTLRFYADSDNHESFACGPEFVTQVELDGGERARKVLFG